MDSNRGAIAKEYKRQMKQRGAARWKAARAVAKAPTT
jgi:hypothetical protein